MSIGTLSHYKQMFPKESWRRGSTIYHRPRITGGTRSKQEGKPTIFIPKKEQETQAEPEVREKDIQTEDDAVTWP